MNRAYGKFKQLMSDTRSVSCIYDYLDQYVKGPMQYDDLLRFQWVQSVAALDKLVHDLVRIGMVDIFSGRRLSTSKYKKFQVDMAWYEDVTINNHMIANEFGKKVILQHGHLSFQDPGKIGDALAYIWEVKDKWTIIATQLGQDSNSVKVMLKNIVTRRNQIAHEGDYIDDFGNRQEIEKNDVDDVLEFIEKLGEAIYICVK